MTTKKLFLPITYSEKTKQKRKRQSPGDGIQLAKGTRETVFDISESFLKKADRIQR